jgi:ATP synthase protein I
MRRVPARDALHAQLGFRDPRVPTYNPKALLDETVGQTPSDRNRSSGAWDDDDPEEAGRPPFRRWTREEAQAMFGAGADNPHKVRPWRVIAVQIVVGLGVALFAGLATGRMEVFWSALYGAGVVVIPGALMARGMTSPLASMSPGTSAVSFMLWEGVKIGVSVVLLMLAVRIVQPLVWPALLAGLVVCIKVYWVALAWRRRV